MTHSSNILPPLHFYLTVTMKNLHAEGFFITNSHLYTSHDSFLKVSAGKKFLGKLLTYSVILDKNCISKILKCGYLLVITVVKHLLLNKNSLPFKKGGRGGKRNGSNFHNFCFFFSYGVQ